MTIPWGDLATAYRTTGIPNIRTYTAQSRKSVKFLRRARVFLPILRIPPIQRVAKWYAGRRKGPSEEARRSGKVELWGRVANARGEEVTLTNVVVEGYDFTVKSAIAAVERVLAPEFTRTGALTPVQAFGMEFVDQVK